MHFGRPYSLRTRKLAKKPGLRIVLRICTGFGGGGLRIVYGFGPDLGEEACGLFMDLDRIWGRRLTDCLRIFTGCGGRGLRIVYGFLPDVEDEAYGLFTDLYRIWGRRLADCLWIWTGFGGGGLRIVYGFGPDLGEKAYGFPTGLCFLADGFCTDFCRSAYGLLGLKRVLVGAGEENHPPEEDVKKMRCKCWQCRQSMVCLPVVVKSLVLVVVHSRPMSWFGNLVLVVVKTYSPEIGGFGTLNSLS